MTTYLLTGDDESILRAAVVELVDRLVGDGDRSMMVDEFDGDDYELRSVVDAAQTPPFLSDKRVVIARGVGRFVTDDVASLVAYVGNPLDTTDLVLVAGGGKVAKKLADAVKAGGTVTNTSPRLGPRTCRRGSPITSRRRACGSSPTLRPQLAQWLGEDVGRLDGILADAAQHLRRRRHGLGRRSATRSSAMRAACRRGTSPMPSTPATPPRR